MIEFTENGVPTVHVSGIAHFRIEQIFDCGQCFRFLPVTPSAYRTEVEGIAYGRYIRFAQNSGDEVYIYPASKADFDGIWRHYLALDRDYDGIREDILSQFALLTGRRDTVIADAVRFGDGIRVLRQEPWETMCSFIVSQNNNIPRIRKILTAMSEKLGKPIQTADGRQMYAFPTAEAILSVGIDGLRALGTGFRAEYLYDAAERYHDGRLSFAAVETSPYEEAKRLLCEVKGIGDKVAACTLLFGFGRTEAFPIDVWIKKILSKYYPSGLQTDKLGQYAGIAQQYLFYYARWQKQASAAKASP